LTGNQQENKQMKRLLGFVVAVSLLAGIAAAYADGGGCMGSKSSTGGACCGGMFSTLKLTPEQNAKVEALKEQCRRATSTSEFHTMFEKGLEQILTADQLAQWKAICAKAAKSSQCPYLQNGGTKN
jgi:Spy/CpxP family protein refolding chaperone